jgi:cyanate permease
VIHQLGYTATDAQLLTIPVYVFAMIVTVGAAFLSDRYRNRSNFIVYPFMVAAVGYIGLLALPHPGLPGATYGMLFVVAGGLYPTICGIISWNGKSTSTISPRKLSNSIANNLAGSWKRSVGMGLQICMGNFGGAIGSNIYLARQAPHYWLGYGFSLGIIMAAILSGFILKILLQRENDRRDNIPLEEVYAKYNEAQLLEMGDRSPLFRYTL